MTSCLKFCQVMHGLELLERHERDADLLVRCCCRVPPCLEVLGESIEVLLLHRCQVEDGGETIVADGHSCHGIDALRD
jgi:hypothetical protein